eukprot:CAMPEP_0118911176 /NCGR_PEP_ID=MMETSP1166-20130328/12981_1 /TAXON_ID=1104430 /ORGANISM="Chrysoreinhardia sp, Strain CCMP3193" /LENGTH=520 /DNA_ID=CAMNT_0006850653 /DNA_START=28 /DNA_END=1590 /DNA_ORIENTATION=+
MAWKRGTQNNLASSIRMGQIEAFTVASSKASAAEDEKVTLKVVAGDTTGSRAYVNAADLPRGVSNFVHAHEHAAVVLRLDTSRASVPRGCIVLNEAQRLNSKVCDTQKVEWTAYRGRHVARDAREGAIGDTTVHVVADPHLSVVVCEARPLEPRRSDDDLKDSSLVRDAGALLRDIATLCLDCLVSVDELFVLDGVVLRIVEVRRDDDDDDDDDDDTRDDDDADDLRKDFDFDDDDFRGLVTPRTTFYVEATGGLALRENKKVPPKKQPPDLVQVTCAIDDEVFPVRRGLLRPCVALTSIAQAGRGKYDAGEESSLRRCSVPMDCCTFDRVLLYLEHEKKRPNVPFRFDPTLAPELLTAAEKLQIAGLQDAARKVLGSFEDRVRREPIRLAEIVERNRRGGLSTPRTDTLLVVDGMVLDVSRWLAEHPGGSSIIPEQALDNDATLMFECYHVSKQSFLYLKEFYIGELFHEDKQHLPVPNNDDDNKDNTPSDAFLEALRRYTPWRLTPDDLVQVPDHHSF